MIDVPDKEGYHLGPYRLHRPLNKGGMGQVWLAYKVFSHGDFQRRAWRHPVAVKFPLLSSLFDPRVNAGLRTEAAIMSMLKHSSIPRTIDVGEHEGVTYVVMDYIPGVSGADFIAQLARRGQYASWEVISSIVRKAGNALLHVHTYTWGGAHQYLVHRDFAPKNLIVNGFGDVYIIDFGVAATALGSSHSTIKGTFKNMAPEQTYGEVSPAVDAYGLGVTLWSLLEGAEFRGAFPQEALNRMVPRGDYPPLRRPGIPEVLRTVCHGWLQPDPLHRMPIDIGLGLLTSHFQMRDDLIIEQVRKTIGHQAFRSGVTAEPSVLYEGEAERTFSAARAAVQEDNPPSFLRSASPSTEHEREPGPRGTRPFSPRDFADERSVEPRMADPDAPLARSDALTLRRQEAPEPPSHITLDDPFPPPPLLQRTDLLDMRTFFAGALEPPPPPEWRPREVTEAVPAAPSEGTTADSRISEVGSRPVLRRTPWIATAFVCSLALCVTGTATFLLRPLLSPTDARSQLRAVARPSSSATERTTATAPSEQAPDGSEHLATDFRAAPSEPGGALPLAEALEDAASPALAIPATQDAADSAPSNVLREEPATATPSSTVLTPPKPKVRVPIDIMLGLAKHAELYIGRRRIDLSVQHHQNLELSPGTRRTRWRIDPAAELRPGPPFRVRANHRYEIMVDARGPIIREIALEKVP